MKKIKYTPEAAAKLRGVNRSVLLQYGEEKAKAIINIYNEKEDFMWLLFGVATTSQETTTYWRE